MSLTLRPVPAQTSVNRAAYVETHRRLRCELEEERISRELTDRRNERLRRFNTFRTTGSLDD